MKSKTALKTIILEYQTKQYSTSTKEEVKYKSSTLGNYVRTGLLSLLVISAVASEGCMTWEEMTRRDPNRPYNNNIGGLGRMSGPHGL